MVGSERKSWGGPRESMEGRNAMSASLTTGHLFPGPLAPWEDGGGGFFSFIFEALVPDTQ